MQKLTTMHVIFQTKIVVLKSESLIVASESSVIIESKKFDNDNLVVYICVETVQESSLRRPS